jgi:hypothetical protein
VLERIGPRLLNFDLNWAPEKKNKYLFLSDAFNNAVTTYTHFQFYIVPQMVATKPAPQSQSSNERRNGKKINILILGNDGICHPLAWKFNKSANVEKIYVQSRNAGIAMLQIPGSQDRVPEDKVRILTRTYETKLEDIPGLAKSNKIDLVVPSHGSYFLSDDLQEKLREGKFSFCNE